MKNICVSIAILLSTMAVSIESHSQDNFPVLKGPYLGQNPPGLTPEIFAPDIVSISGRYEYGISFSPDLGEVYFSASKKDEDSDIYFSMLDGGKWSPIKKANFTKGKKDSEMEPFVSFDDKKIYFTAHNSDFTDTKIWYVNRFGDSWGDATKLDSPVNSSEVFYSNESEDGALFYTDVSKLKMYYAPSRDGEFPEAREVKIKFGVHGFISPHQDYLLVNAQNNKDEKRKDSDIYVYFKEEGGAWGKPILLGDAVNSKFNETCPSITPDGKYLFFSRYNEEGGVSNFYWVSAQVIENLRPKL